MPRYEMFKSRLDKLNPEVPAINKTQADDALISFFALVTGTPIARMRNWLRMASRAGYGVKGSSGSHAKFCGKIQRNGGKRTEAPKSKVL